MKNVNLRCGLTGRTILKITEEAKRLDNEQKDTIAQKKSRLNELKEQLDETGKLQDLNNLIDNLHELTQRSYDNGHGSIFNSGALLPRCSSITSSWTKQG